MNIQTIVDQKVEPKQFGRVAVLMGGPFAEREVSLMSGNAVLQALQEAGLDVYAIDVDDSLCEKLLKDRPDRIFLAMHGTFGEDGTIQGLLDTLKIPYTGSDVLASALAMNKEKCKYLWKGLGLPTLDFMLVDAGVNIDFAEVKAKLGLPLAVKPVSEGSSVGVTCVQTEEEFAVALKKAGQFQCKVMIEPWIVGDELTISIVANTALPVIRIVAPIGFYDYEAKYFSDETQYHIPCGLSKEKEHEVQELGLQAYSSLGCRHWGRVDAILDKNGKVWLLEVNTIPGLTGHSLVPQAAAAMGINFKNLILTILKQTL